MNRWKWNQVDVRAPMRAPLDRSPAGQPPRDWLLACFTAGLAFGGAITLVLQAMGIGSW